MHPVSFDIDYAIERDRLTVFFRLVLAIPWMIVAFLYGLVAVVVLVIAWFALMFTGRFPHGLYNLMAGFIRYSTRFEAWLVLATDEWPPFGRDSNPEYPVHIEVEPPQESYSRVKTFFKIVTALPQLLLSYGIQLLVMAAAFISWWRILFTGKQSATMHDALRVGLAYLARSNAFLMLLTETHPRLLDLPVTTYPEGTPALPATTPPAAPQPAPPPPT